VFLVAGGGYGSIASDDDLQLACPHNRMRFDMSAILVV